MNFTISLDTDIAVEYTCKSLRYKNKLYLYEGWVNEENLEDVIQKNIDQLKNYSGEFFVVEIDKNSKTVKIINDKKCSFLIFYNTKHNTISTNLLNFSDELDYEWCQNAFDRMRTEVFSKDIGAIEFYKKRYLTDTNNYLLKNTFYIPPRCELICTKDSFQLNEYTSLNTMFSPVDIQTEDELIEFVKNRLTTNVQRIYENYNQNKILFGSTGIDSLTLLSLLLEQNKPFELINYYFTDVTLSNEKRQRAKQLESFIKEKNINTHTHTYTIKNFLELFKKNVHLINHYLGNSDILYDVLASLPFKSQIRLKGTWGDECFWHEEHALMFYYKQHGYSYSESKKLCATEYCSLSLGDTVKLQEEEYNQATEQNWKENCKLYYMFKYPNYITSERQFSNELAFSPYADDVLLNLPYKLQNDELSLYCIKGTLQKQLIHEDILKFLNANKDGEQSIKSLEWDAPDPLFLKNLENNKLTYYQVKNLGENLITGSPMNFNKFDRYCLFALIKRLLNVSK